MQGRSTGVLVASATILLFVPVEWFFMRLHFVLLQALTAVWFGSLVATWVLVKKRPAWTLTRIDGLISALDAHARPADGNDAGPHDVRKAVESTLNLLEHKLDNRVTVHQDYETTDEIFAPARAFNQVLLNLVDNALRSGANNIWIELRQVDKKVSVVVSDDGPGVPQDMVHRIFDPFFTTRVEGEGAGLGLHLSRRIAQECGGELRYESRPGGGARFVMEIPAMEQAA